MDDFNGPGEVTLIDLSDCISNATLDKLPHPFGFRVSCFPYNIQGASAAWTRAVVIFEHARD